MFTETEGIILRQTKIAGGRRMVLLFSEKYGKISAGTGLNERGKGKNALVMRPFTYGKYELFKKGNFININGGEVLQSHYRIGEDVDKYMEASFALEFVDKITEEEMPLYGLFELMKVFLSELEKRKSKYDILIIAFMMKALHHLGYAPELSVCTLCGNKKEPVYFSIPDGGVVCDDCDTDKFNGLIYPVNFDIVNVLTFVVNQPVERLQNLALGEYNARIARRMVLDYAKYHMDFGKLKSESFINE